jgi:hypothetical protein
MAKDGYKLGNGGAQIIKAPNPPAGGKSGGDKVKTGNDLRTGK